jgi:cobalt-precorrin 5A hydrolase
MTRIISLTDAGNRLGERLSAAIEGSEHWHKPKPFKASVQDAFCMGERLVLICATGIAVRTLAPVLQDKHSDPAVLVLDELGQFVIPLLSGHEGGANDWAAEVADALKAQLVMTTAKPYLKPVYSVGMGCERSCPADHLAELLSNCLAQAGLEMTQIQNINSIDIKADEAGLITLAQHLDKPFDTYDAVALNTVDDLLSTRSDYIFSVVGVNGVAESAALYAAQQMTGEAAELVLVKQKTARATCAIARSYPKQSISQ